MKAKLAILMAMEEEAKPLIKSLKMGPVNLELNHKWPNQVFCSSVDPEVYLITNGLSGKAGSVSRVGTQAASISAFIALELLCAQTVLNAGTAGGFRERGGEIGDVYLCDKAFYHDRRVPIDDNWKAFAKGGYQLHSEEGWFSKYGFKKGIISTGNSLDFVDRDLEMINAEGACVKEMEAAAVAELCEHTSTPLVVIKSITDIVDGPHPTAEEFVKNLNQASESLNGHLNHFLQQEFGIAF